MAIFEFAPALEISRKIVKEKTNKAVLKLVPDITSGEVVADRTFGILLTAIFTLGLIFLLAINTALAQDAFKLSELKVQAQILKDEREAILRKVAEKSSPDKLAESASNLGMVPISSPNFLDMSGEIK
jgi:cell division protein FtsL